MSYLNNMKSRLCNFIKIQIVIAILTFSPTFFITCIVNKITKNNNKFLKNIFIRLYIKLYKIDLHLYQKKDINLYNNFHSFFIRDLDLSLRVLQSQKDLVIPADGLIKAIGPINSHALYQAKNKFYNLKDLFGCSFDFQKFSSGSYFTIYLSPKDYHKIHMPCDGILEKMIYVPGTLFPVNQISCTNISQIYTRNERVIVIFKIYNGYMAIIFSTSATLEHIPDRMRPAANLRHNNP